MATIGQSRTRQLLRDERVQHTYRTASFAFENLDFLL